MMMLPVEKIGPVLATFIDKHVLPNATSPWQIASTVFIGAAFAQRGSQLPDSVKSVMQMLGVMKENKIDIGFAYALAKEALAKVGVLDIFGVNFTRSDLDALYNIAKSHSVEVDDE